VPCKLPVKISLRSSPAIDRVTGQLIKPSSRHVSQIEGEKLNDEHVTICPTCPARKAVILWPDAGIGFSVILDDIIWHLKTFWEAHIVHVTPERLGPRPLGAKASSLSVATPTVALVAHAVLYVYPSIFPTSPTACHRLEESARMARLETRWGPHW
jgi:hypothetical protein